MTVNHDASGAVSGVQGATSTTYGYDANGNVISQTDASGNAKTTGYNDLNQPVNQTDELGNTTYTQLDQAGRPTLTVDANGYTNTFLYDGSGNQILAIDALGAATYTGYADPITNSDGSVIAGLVSATTNVAPGVPYSVVTSYSYYTTSGSGGSPDLNLYEPTIVRMVPTNL